MPILHTPLLLSLCVLASHLHRLCLLDRRLLHRLLSWVRHVATFAFSTGACCTVSCQARHPATCAFSTGACCKREERKDAVAVKICRGREVRFGPSKRVSRG